MKRDEMRAMLESLYARKAKGETEDRSKYAKNEREQHTISASMLAIQASLSIGTGSSSSEAQPDSSVPPNTDNSDSQAVPEAPPEAPDAPSDADFEEANKPKGSYRKTGTTTNENNTEEKAQSEGATADIAETNKAAKTKILPTKQNPADLMEQIRLRVQARSDALKEKSSKQGEESSSSNNSGGGATNNHQESVSKTKAQLTPTVNLRNSLKSSSKDPKTNATTAASNSNSRLTSGPRQPSENSGSTTSSYRHSISTGSTTPSSRHSTSTSGSTVSVSISGTSSAMSSNVSSNSSTQRSTSSVTFNSKSSKSSTVSSAADQGDAESEFLQKRKSLRKTGGSSFKDTSASTAPTSINSPRFELSSGSGKNMPAKSGASMSSQHSESRSVSTITVSISVDASGAVNVSGANSSASSVQSTTAIVTLNSASSTLGTVTVPENTKDKKKSRKSRKADSPSADDTLAVEPSKRKDKTKRKSRKEKKEEDIATAETLSSSQANSDANLTQKESYITALDVSAVTAQEDPMSRELPNTGGASTDDGITIKPKKRNKSKEKNGSATAETPSSSRVDSDANLIQIEQNKTPLKINSLEIKQGPDNSPRTDNGISLSKALPKASEEKLPEINQGQQFIASLAILKSFIEGHKFTLSFFGGETIYYGPNKKIKNDVPKGLKSIYDKTENFIEQIEFPEKREPRQDEITPFVTTINSEIDIRRKAGKSGPDTTAIYNNIYSFMSKPLQTKLVNNKSELRVIALNLEWLYEELSHVSDRHEFERVLEDFFTFAASSQKHAEQATNELKKNLSFNILHHAFSLDRGENNKQFPRTEKVIRHFNILLDRYGNYSNVKTNLLAILNGIHKGTDLTGIAGYEELQSKLDLSSARMSYSAS